MFCKVKKIDSDRCVLVVEMPDGAFKIEGLITNEAQIPLNHQTRVSQMVFSYPAILALRELLNKISEKKVPEKKPGK